MNKILKFCLFCLIGSISLSACSDMIESDSDRQIFDPELNEKTDSIFYTFGILKGMQEVADQYVMFNIMRGDLVTTNSYSETDLKELANFSATTTNKFDSAYVYYRIINNCNYYIAHRDTSLRTGSRQVTLPEYAEAKAIRAWAYLQLVRTYGTVPFFTEPITTIGQVNEVTATVDRMSLCSQLAAELAEFSGTAVPSYGSINAGTINSGGTKTVSSNLCMVPIDLVLGDLYLESEQYKNAALSYFAYLKKHELYQIPYYVRPMLYRDELSTVWPSDFMDINSTGLNWENIFTQNSTVDIITYIPMAVNRLNGTVSDLPAYFGYDYYSTAEEVSISNTNSTTRVGRYLLNRQIDPSSTYLSLVSAQPYYYTPSTASNNVVKEAEFGDLRRYASMVGKTANDSSFNVISKLLNTNIPIYRRTVVYLRLAECFNRMGYPDAAFAVLKDRIQSGLLTDSTYITDATKAMLLTEVPFLSTENSATFSPTNYQNTGGVHACGSGLVSGAFSPYQMDTIVGLKIKELNEAFGLSIDSTNATKQDTINAVEDLICDELALEAAFEGGRFSDLCRFARHKNSDSPASYGANFGGKWIAKKLAFKNPVVDLSNEQNWYMKMK